MRTTTIDYGCDNPDCNTTYTVRDAGWNEPFNGGWVEFKKLDENHSLTVLAMCSVDCLIRYLTETKEQIDTMVNGIVTAYTDR